ncbi:MAG: hypothetical protein HZA90_11140 [Verrucomicrobia bacterium]|nr:hypothetical protein [Verrucomicrobiota bacterium]
MASKTMTMEIPASEAAKYEAAIDDYIAKIDRSLERNRRMQTRIDRLKAETREILIRVKAHMR